MKTKILFILSFVLITNLSANYAKTYNYDDVQEDFTAQNTEKYQKDNLVQLNEDALIEKNIIASKDQLTIANNTNAISCNFVSSDYTATVYNIDAKRGVVTCMVAKKGDLYNPIGIFNTTYPNMIEYFKKDLEKAKQATNDIAAAASSQFAPLYEEKESIFRSMNQQTDSNHMTIPDLLLSTILTDVNIIDIENTNLTNKLQLKSGFTSTIYDKDGVSDTSNQMILADAESIFSNFTSISDLSMTFLIMLIVLFGTYGLINGVGSKLMAHAQDQKKTLMPWGVGMLAGVILFFPSSEVEFNQNNQALTDGYSLHQNRFMDFSRDGYYMMSSWSKDVTKAIIDNEFNMMIDKAGISTGESIVLTYAAKEQTKKIKDFTANLNTICMNSYALNKMTDSKKAENYYSNDENTLFPSSENYAYAASLIKSGTSTIYYNSIGSGGLVNNSAYASGASGNSYYPNMSLSSCGKIYYQTIKAIDLESDFEKAYQSAVTSSNANNGDKINALKTMMNFQYGLYRDWGFLSILGLPIMKMQTEAIGGLYANPNNSIVDKLNEKIDGGGVVGGTIHSLASSIPYMMIPGISNIYNHIGKLYTDILDGIDKSGIGMAKNFFGGGIVTSTVKNGLAFYSSYTLAKTILVMLPIIGLLIIGLLRFIVIYIKILSFHFAALFIMPVIFAMNNLDAMKSFFIKIFSTMLELPLFVLAVWLAMTANNLIHSVGDIFGKRILIGMIDNNEAMHQAKELSYSDIFNMNFQIVDTMKIYFLDGLVTIAIALFSVVIIYKIIVNLHTAIFELIEVKGTATLDNTIDAMKSEMGSHGSKI